MAKRGRPPKPKTLNAKLKWLVEREVDKLMRAKSDLETSDVIRLLDLASKLELRSNGEPCVSIDVADLTDEELALLRRK